MPSSFAIGEHFEKFIDRLIESGRYNSRSEVVREGLRLLEAREDERDQALKRLEDLVREALESGESEPAETVFAELRARYEKMKADAVL
jgi:antitoxin ParD1/3/4